LVNVLTAKTVPKVQMMIFQLGNLFTVHSQKEVVEPLAWQWMTLWYSLKNATADF
jgi:hypothetical protein